MASFLKSIDNALQSGVSSLNSGRGVGEAVTDASRAQKISMLDSDISRLKAEW